MSNIDKRALNQAELESALLELKRISEQPAVSTHYARVLRQHIANMGHRIAELDKRLIEYAGIATREARRVAELEARAVYPAILDVIAERQRQQSVEGWTPEQRAGYDAGIAELKAMLGHSVITDTPPVPVVKLPATRCWAGISNFYYAADVIAAIRAAGVEVSND